MIFLDFETKTILDRPDYPPNPVGVAIADGIKYEYLAWGHPTENNSTFEEARKRLNEIYETHSICCHNAKFDLEVSQKFFDLPLIPKHGFHDVKFLAFLYNSHETSLRLKTLASKYLGMPPDEQEAVKAWLFENRKDLTKGKSRKTWGGCSSYTSEAPGKLVGTYAIGDVIRTQKLFDFYIAKIEKSAMLGAYQRELKLMPLLLKNEQTGIRIDLEKLKQDLVFYEERLEDIDDWLRDHLGMQELNLDKSSQLADALEKAGYITTWQKTKTGRRATNKKALVQSINDTRILDVLKYRAHLATDIRTFMRPWQKMALLNGRIYTNWNQTRGPDGKGARTGRISSNPNFQNIPKFQQKESDGKPDSFCFDYDLPNIRTYILADSEEDALLMRDYSQQEVRILAHFEDGSLMREYQKDPRLDLHLFAAKTINQRTNKNFSRTQVKAICFGIIYGMGAARLAKILGCELAEAKEVKDAYLNVFEGLKLLQRKIKMKTKVKSPLKTWGGRLFYVESPKIVKGKLQSYEYKMLNTLIQGSAADCIKEAIIRTSECSARFMLTVHDELIFSTTKSEMKKNMRHIKTQMESIEFDVKMLSDGKIGSSWGALQPYED